MTVPAPHSTNVICLDAAWFRRHPDRSYRLRRATPGEIVASGVTLLPYVSKVHAIVRADGQVQLTNRDRALADQDDTLAGLFSALEMFRAPAKFRSRK